MRRGTNGHLAKSGASSLTGGPINLPDETGWAALKAFCHQVDIGDVLFLLLLAS
jgi:hypothetical protein